MKLSRRSFIKSGIGLAGSAVPTLGIGQDIEVKGLFLSLGGLGSLPAELITEIGRIFVDRSLSICLNFAPERDGSFDQTRCAALFALADENPGLVELAPSHVLAGDGERYLQLREAIRLRERLRAGAGGAVAPRAMPVALFMTDTDDMIAPFAWRSGGFRIHVMPAPLGLDQAQQSVVDAFDWGVLRLAGGINVPLSEDPAKVLATLASFTGDQLMVLTLDEASAADRESLLAAARLWADSLLAAAFSGAIYPTRPSDYLLQGNPGASKHLALVIDLGAASEPDEGTLAFMADLYLQKFPFTLLVRPDASILSLGYDVCISAPAPEDGAEAGRAICRLAPAGGALAEGDEQEIVLVPDGGQTGPAADGRFHIAMPAPSDESFADRLAADPMTDAIEVIRPEQVATPFQRLVMLQDIAGAHYDGRILLHSVRSFVTELLAPDQVIARFHAARRRIRTDPPAPLVVTDFEARQLRKDAELAWRYIARFRNPWSGICAGTVRYGETSQTIGQDVTLWDVASQMQGTRAAAAIGIIDRTEAAEQIGRIVRHLPVNDVGGVPMPPRQFRADDLQTVLRGFDSCDAGRFLVALDAVVADGLVEREEAETALGKWGLDTAISEGRAFNRLGRVWTDVTDSHCSPYGRFGFAAWGMQIKGAYAEFLNEGDGDDRIGLLYNAARIGHFGTEPLLLQALEVGHTPQSRYLTEVLFDAQLSWWERTGEFKCVSETPLNFEPWFAYQGLRVDLSGRDAWVIATRSRSTEYWSEEFRARADLISAKSAYLWAAAYPHLYSTRLKNLIRTRARVEDVGFSVGLNTGSLEQMANYSDLNTNGVILTAIASMLAV